MTQIIGNTHAHQIIDLSVNRALWGALFHTMPTLIDPLAAEVAGGGYARPAATMAREGRRLVNQNTLIWPGVPEGMMVAVGLFGAATNGELWIATSFTPALSTPGGKPVTLAPGELAFSL